MAEGYNINDSGIPTKYGIIIAFARKTWKLRPSILCCVQLGQFWAGNITPETNAHTPHKIVHSFRVWNTAAYMHTANSVMNHMLVSICVWFYLKLLFRYKQ
jgi:hypothetical protein